MCGARIARDEENEGMTAWGRIGQVVGTTALGAIGALHLLWAFGASWPASNREELAKHVIGGDDMPSAAPCLVVGGGMLTAAVIVAGAGGTRRLATTARAAISLAFLLRGAINGAAVTEMLGRPGADRAFVLLDRRVYRPLCLVIGGAVAIATAGRR